MNNTTREQLIDLGIVPNIDQDPTIQDLLYQVNQLLDGIDRTQDNDGWWQTEDGARIGKIKLRELKEIIRQHWTNKTNNSH